MKLYKPLTAEEARMRGLGRFVVDRSTHPSYYASSWPPSGSGVDTLGRRRSYRLPHLNFNSVLVVAISNHWQPGCWWRLQHMLRFTEKAGISVAFEEVDDMSIMPPDAIGIMRACAAMLALDAGFEWCLMLDTDCWVEEDTLVKLMAHDRPIVFPLAIADNDEYPWGALSSPRFVETGGGLHPVLWATMSCMLFNTKVFNCLAPYAWHGHDFHFAQNLAHFGHRSYVDTDTVVHLTRGPARHPSTPWPELWRRLEKGYESRRIDERHREPPPDFDPAFDEGVVDERGVYWAVDSWRRLGANGPMDGNPDPTLIDTDPDAVEEEVGSDR